MRYTIWLGWAVAGCSSGASAQAATWEATGNVTFRYENEYDSAIGVADQERFRLRLRSGVTWHADDVNQLTIRARTGSLTNQHSPTVTVKALDENPPGRRDLYIDLWSWAHRNAGTAVTVGRHLWPFWANTDYFWDTDVNPVGVVVERNHASRDAVTALTVSAPPDGGLDVHGRLGGLQHRRHFGKHGEWRVAFGAVLYDGGPGARHLTDADLDYRIGTLALEWTGRLFSVPAQLGLDLFHNFERYAFQNPGARSGLENERTGYGVKFSFGENRTRGDVGFRYNYFYVERFATVSGFAQDTTSPFDTTDISGHDLRLIYSLSEDWTVMMRLSESQAISGPESAQRLRIDIEREF